MPSVDLLDIRELISVVALAFTTGPGDLGGNDASHVAILSPFSLT